MNREVKAKEINCTEQRFGGNTVEKNFTKVRFGCNFVQVYMNANVLIAENMVALF